MTGEFESRWDCECEKSVPGHDRRCLLHAVELTKGEFVEASESTAKVAIETYLFLRAEGDSHDAALDATLGEIGEANACYVGIGSCGGGGCKHG